MALSLLACATRSVPDCIRTELRTVLAIGFADHTDGPCLPRKSQPAQLSSLGKDQDLVLANYLLTERRTSK